MAITTENFNEFNRTRKIGNSEYKICNTDPSGKNGQWYIRESLNTGDMWSIGRGFYSDSLKETIKRINSFTQEGEVIALRYNKKGNE